MTGSWMGRVSQPVLPLLPAQARSVGPSVGLLEGTEGGVVFVFGLVTFTFDCSDQAGRRLAAVQLVRTKIASARDVASAFDCSDQAGRRLAAVQLVRTKIASARDVASAFGVTETTLWRWVGAFTDGGVAALVPEQSGPKGPSKLTERLRTQIVAADAAGLTLSKIAAQVGVSTATVRVALGRGGSRSAPQTEPLPASPLDDNNDDAREDEQHADVAELVVLAAPVPRTAERVAARFGDLVQAPVRITEGAQLPLVGLLLALPALEMTGLLPVAAEV